MLQELGAVVIGASAGDRLNAVDRNEQVSKCGPCYSDTLPSLLNFTQDSRGDAVLLDRSAISTEDELARRRRESGKTGDRKVLVVKSVVVGDQNLGLGGGKEWLSVSTTLKSLGTAMSSKPS